MTTSINPSIFREYDIRGIAGTDLTEENMELMGRAYVAYLKKRKALKTKTVVIGRDVANHDVSIAVHAPVAFTSGVATRTDLEPVIPNPTRGSSAVRYSLTTRGRVNVAVYSVDGRLVKTLVSGVQDAGQYQVLWDGADAQGAPAKPGMFFVRFETEGVRKSRTLSVIR